MGAYKNLYVLLLLSNFMLLVHGTYYNEDKTCRSRSTNNSVICVCTADYCDTITREVPVTGRYFAYTSSQGGLRFSKSTGVLQKHTDDKSNPTLVLDPTIQYQSIEGFGGAVTDSFGINWLALNNETLKSHLINSYFGANGIEYNMIRTPIGGSDFSTHPYTLQDSPENDLKLSNFSLVEEDYKYKIPAIKACIDAATAPVHIVASCWSPPVWMKHVHNITGTSRLKKEYTQPYADYHLKFLDSYAKENISIWALTTSNEPLSGIMSLGSVNRLGWTTRGMGLWIANNLGPTIRNSAYKNITILAGDDQRFSIVMWYNVVIEEVPEADKYIDGIAVHFYFDDLTPPEQLTRAIEGHPGKYVIATEACTGVTSDQPVLLGSWDRAKKYINSILEDLNYNVVGWIDWNMALNEQGGPTYVSNFIDAPIIVFPDKGEFVKQPMFYAMGHFSKFVPRGSKRINVKATYPDSTPLANIAFLTPRNTIVVVLHNEVNQARAVRIQLGQLDALVYVEAQSIVTVEFPYSQ
ncbi:lysosomal acid glucosylceramidase-like [Achroia grisella]|uniref:lysosomal acid glucosylceramidase-like n=1 Tax=Achroia grisella TaxID=688607 RepID=UPI0027D32B97|nr:lysosomal acid glucosylceramidase-like [Achroia grisella]